MAMISILTSLAQIEISVEVKGKKKGKKGTVLFSTIFYSSSRSSPMHRINLFSKKETIKIEPSPFYPSFFIFFLLRACRRQVWQSSGKEEIWQKMKLKKYRG